MATYERSSTEGNDPSSAGELRTTIEELHGAARAIELRAFEGPDGPDVAGLVLAVERLLQWALGLLDAVVRYYEGSAHESVPKADSGATDVRALRAAHARRTEDTARVTDVAAVGAMVLRGRLGALAGGGRTRWEAVSLVAGALRAMQKSLAATDVAIAHCEGLDAHDGFFRAELERSLLVRREYALFRWDLLALAPPTADTVHQRLRSAGNLIARLVGSNAYPHLRMRDRALLRGMQDRLRVHLVAARGEPAALASEGLRLWQDVDILVRLFAGVNRREELVRHDAELVRSALAALRDTPGEQSPDAKTFESLAALTGRDDELDRLLHDADCTVAALRERLVLIHEGLSEGARPERRADGSTPSAPPPDLHGDRDYL